MVDFSKLVVHENRYGYLTEQQFSILCEFKSSIQSDPSLVYNPLRHTDHLCLQFLRARAFNLKDALLMFGNCERWREENQITALISFQLAPHASAKLHELYPRYYHKTDGWGRPLYIEALSKFDYKSIFSIVNEDDLFKSHIASYEHLYRVRYPACSAVAGHHIEESFIILDCYNAPLMQIGKIMSMIGKITEISKNYYPECMFKMYVINTPMMFSGIYSCIKPILDPATKKKIQVVGSSYSKLLLEYIPSENLPVYYGGTCNCPGGCMNSDEGPWKAHFRHGQM